MSETRTPAGHWPLIGRFLAPHGRALVGFAALVVVAGAVPLAGPILLGRIVDVIGADVAIATLVVLAAGVGLVGAIAGGAELLVTWLGTRLAWTAANELRVEVARHALALGPAWHDTTTPGAVVDRVDGDATRIGELLGQVVVRFAATAVTLLGVVALLAWQDLRMGAALLVVLLIGGAVLIRLRDLTVPAGVEARRRVGEVFGAAVERLQGAEELRALGGGPYAVADLHQRSSATMRAYRRQEVLGSTMWATAMLIVVGGGAIALGGGILLQRAGVLSVGDVLAAFTATQLTRRPLEQLAEQLQQAQQAASGAARLAELLRQQPVVRFTGDEALPDGPLAVALRGVQVRYPGAPDDALHGIDLTLAPGEHLGIVGPSGGGKTTLGRLLSRGLDPRQGTVEVGGVTLAEVAEPKLRQRIAVVTQQVQLLSASVRDNLTLLGTVPADDDRLREVVHAVGLDSWLVQQPQGLDAVLGRDTGTSAGQAQLLALARVLLRDPGLVVLDEPTARLDVVSAIAVTRALEVLLNGRTAVVIAHRLATLERVDTIAVVRDGRIVETGSFLALSNPGSRFAALVAAELGADAGADVGADAGADAGADVGADAGADAGAVQKRAT